MNRSSPTRAEIRLSLALFLALVFLFAGLSALPARNGKALGRSSLHNPGTPIQSVASGIVNFRQLYLSQEAPHSWPDISNGNLVAVDDAYRLQDRSGSQVEVSAERFWAAVSINGPYATRVQHEPDNDRWIVAAI